MFITAFIWKQFFYAYIWTIPAKIADINLGKKIVILFLALPQGSGCRYSLFFMKLKKELKQIAPSLTQIRRYCKRRLNNQQHNKNEFF